MSGVWPPTLDLLDDDVAGPSSVSKLEVVTERRTDEDTTAADNRRILEELREAVKTLSDTAAALTRFPPTQAPENSAAATNKATPAVATLFNDPRLKRRGHVAQQRGATSRTSSPDGDTRAPRQEDVHQDILGPSSTQWRPTTQQESSGEHDRLVELIAASTQAAIRAVTQQRSGQCDARTLPTFSGLEWEDPAYFLDELEECLERNQVAERDLVRTALNQLGGEAKRTFEPFRSVKLDFNTF